MLRPAYHPGRYHAPSEREALEIAVGAILTQNTAWSNVEKAIAGLRGASALTPDALRKIPRRRLEKLIRSSGYFRQKAVKLLDFLRHVDGRGGSIRRWLSGPLDSLREDLLSVRGVGPETADSILLYAGGRSAFVVDAYTIRIGRRIGWYRQAAYDQVQRYLVERLPCSKVVYQEFHALIVALAKYHCRTEPLCGACPLREGCRHGRKHAN